MGVQMTSLKLVVRFFKGRCHGKQFLLDLSTRLMFVTPVASGAAGRANVELCTASIVRSVPVIMPIRPREKSSLINSVT